MFKVMLFSVTVFTIFSCKNIYIGDNKDNIATKLGISAQETLANKDDEIDTKPQITEKSSIKKMKK